MKPVRDDGEPIPPGRRDQARAEGRALRDVVVFAIVLGAVAALNAILGLLLIELAQAIEAPSAGQLSIGAARR